MVRRLYRSYSASGPCNRVCRSDCVRSALCCKPGSRCSLTQRLAACRGAAVNLLYKRRRERLYRLPNLRFGGRTSVSPDADFTASLRDCSGLQTSICVTSVVNYQKNTAQCNIFTSEEC